MRNRITWNRPPLFGGRRRALLPDGGPAHTAETRYATTHDTEIGLFVGGATFVGHGAIVDGTARLTIQRGLSGFVTLFVSVDGEVRGVTEALVRRGTLVVDARDGHEDALAFLAPFGARSVELHDEPRLAPDAASQWMASLARRGFMEPPKRMPAGGSGAAHGAASGAD